MKKKFYGKWIVLACFLIACFPVSIVNVTTSFYLAPICKEYGFSIGAFSISYSIAALGAAIGAVAVGSIMEKLDVKWIMAIGCVLRGIVRCFAFVAVLSFVWLH